MYLEGKGPKIRENLKNAKNGGEISKIHVLPWYKGYDQLLSLTYAPLK